MITLANMTPHQCYLLDCIWDCDTPAELNEFISTLDSAEQVIARNLVSLIVLENIDIEQSRNQANRAARDVLVDIMRK